MPLHPQCFTQLHEVSSIADSSFVPVISDRRKRENHVAPYRLYPPFIAGDLRLLSALKRTGIRLVFTPPIAQDGRASKDPDSTTRAVVGATGCLRKHAWSLQSWRRPCITKPRAVEQITRITRPHVRTLVRSGAPARSHQGGPVLRCDEGMRMARLNLTRTSHE
jgi:hypothetical protein